MYICFIYISLIIVIIIIITIISIYHNIFSSQFWFP